MPLVVVTPAVETFVVEMNLTANLSAWEPLRVDVSVRRLSAQRLDQLAEPWPDVCETHGGVVGRGGQIPWAPGPTMSASVRTPVIVPWPCGHGCGAGTPAGAVKFVQKKTMIPPLMAGRPKWI